MQSSGESVRVSVENVSKVYEYPEVIALQDISFTVKHSEFVVIVGPSGCGKSTLLSMVAGLTPCSSGTIRVDGEEIKKPDPRKISLMFQDPLLLPWRNVAANIELPLEAAGISKEERTERVKKYLQLVGLSGFGRFHPRQLSGGMRQRVALCRSLAMETDLLLMDEPFGALDEQTRLVIADELARIWSQVNKTIIFVTHSLSEAAYLASKIIVLSSRPGTLKEIIDVNLPRPRRFDTPEFGKLSQRLWDTLKRESI